MVVGATQEYLFRVISLMPMGRRSAARRADSTNNPGVISARSVCFLLRCYLNFSKLHLKPYGSTAHTTAKILNFEWPYYSCSCTSQSVHGVETDERIVHKRADTKTRRTTRFRRKSLTVPRLCMRDNFSVGIHKVTCHQGSLHEMNYETLCYDILPNFE